MMQGENCPFVFGQGAELEILVLKLEVSQLDFVDYLFSNLRVDWYILKPCLIRDFRGIVELSRRESLHVGIDDDEFAPEPACNVFV